MGISLPPLSFLIRQQCIKHHLPVSPLLGLDCTPYLSVFLMQPLLSWHLSTFVLIALCRLLCHVTVAATSRFKERYAIQPSYVFRNTRRSTCVSLLYIKERTVSRRFVVPAFKEYLSCGLHQTVFNISALATDNVSLVY